MEPETGEGATALAADCVPPAREGRAVNVNAAAMARVPEVAIPAVRIFVTAAG
jgi:hypothetical protein